MSMKMWEEGLNPEQLQAVTHQGTPLLVLAGAGSGKTRVLTHRAFYLIGEQGVGAEKIALLTFTNKAAGEMKSRVERMGGGTVLGFAGTFHTFGARILRRYGQHLGLSNNFVIYDTSDQEAIMKKVLKKLGLSGKNNQPGMYMHLIGRMKNDLVTKEIFALNAGNEFTQKVLSVWGEYDKMLVESNAVDFDDLLFKTVQLFKNDTFYDRFKDTYEYVLVDEYQDTNKAQFELTKLLANKRAGLMVVGDAAQAIYSFRGADFRNLMMLDTEFSDLTTIKLPKNYRSTQNILDAAYSLIANNVNHPILQLKAEKERGEKIDLIEVIDEKEEAAYVVGLVEEASGVNEEVAVLYRTNAQSRALEEALIKRRIPYRLVGGVRFYDRREIKDLLSGLRVIFNPLDTVCWERIEKNLGKRVKKKLSEWMEKEREELLLVEPFELLQLINEQSDYLSRFDEKNEEDAARLENIRELMAVSSEFKTLESFLESVALIQADEIADRKNETIKVTLMTIHAAKGLEFDRVIITGLEEGLLPHSRSLLNREDIEEERRLMYVAMTRAKKRLYLSLARSRLMYGGRHATVPSRFLAEIPEELLRSRFSRNDYRKLEDQTNSFVEERRIVPDWDVVEKETKADFEEIDAW